MSVHAPLGSLTLVSLPQQEQRTAAGLVLTGRMRADSGVLSWKQSHHPGALRRCSVLVDAPTVTEPETHLRVKDLVRESLALIPAGHRRPSPAHWWQQHTLTARQEDWVDALLPAARIELLCALALADPTIQVLALDSPDRHSPESRHWCLSNLVRLAQQPTRPLAVVVLVAHPPPHWDGPTVRVPDLTRSAP